MADPRVEAVADAIYEAQLDRADHPYGHLAASFDGIAFEYREGYRILAVAALEAVDRYDREQVEQGSPDAGGGLDSSLSRNRVEASSAVPAVLSDPLSVACPMVGPICGSLGVGKPCLKHDPVLGWKQIPPHPERVRAAGGKP